MLKAFRQNLQSPAVIAVLISISLSIGVIAIRKAGVIERLELIAYDWFLKLQTTAETPPPIALVTITEDDIRTQDRWPLSDAKLATVLNKLMSYDPTAIGLDIYRDRPLPPGQEELEEIFKKNPRIIAIMKFPEGDKVGVPAPPIIANSEQVGFSDILVDTDHIVRRAPLFLGDGKTVVYSFALRVTLVYLRALGLSPRPDTSDPAHIHLGRTTLRPLEPNSGSYVGADTRGYQFLLDFKDALREFPSFTLTALLSGKVDADEIRGKIVLLGTMAESVSDRISTPLGYDFSGLALHANTIAQLLRVSLQGTAPIKTLNDFQEAAWILLWGCLGAAFSLRIFSPWRIALTSSVSLILLALFCYGAFVSGWWIPVIPPAITWLICTAVTIAYALNQQTKKLDTVMRLYARDLSPTVPDNAGQQHHRITSQTASERLISTVLFTDVIDFNSVDQKMRVGVYERGEGGERTLRPYEYNKVASREVEDACLEVTALLNRANKRARVTPEILDNLKKTGQVLFDLLIPRQARENLATTKSKDLILYVDDKLVGVPWELLFDGQQFLSRKFAMGRVVSTHQALTSRSTRDLALPFNVLIVADSRGDLEASYREGIEIRNFLDENRETFHVDFRSHPVGVSFLKKKLRDYDMVHYAGHGDYQSPNFSDSGWLLNDGTLKASDVTAMGGLKPMPSLVFSNACQTGQTGEWEIRDDYEEKIFGLANAYLIAGVQHYIGTFWEILDEPSSHFARSFYGYLALGERAGEAVRRARQDLIQAYGEETIVWASYMLYGDPTFRFFPARR